MAMLNVKKREKPINNDAIIPQYNNTNLMIIMDILIINDSNN
jgi:hypothetical protein